MLSSNFGQKSQKNGGIIQLSPNKMPDSPKKKKTKERKRKKNCYNKITV